MPVYATDLAIVLSLQLSAFCQIQESFDVISMADFMTKLAMPGHLRAPYPTNITLEVGKRSCNVSE